MSYFGIHDKCQLERSIITYFYTNSITRLLNELNAFAMSLKHTFHIPVMGTGFTLDTPLKVAHLGIDSVVSIVDDVLIEKMRRRLCTRFDIAYEAITEKAEDFRAKRITSYLNLLNELVTSRFYALKDGSRESLKEIRAYLNLLPDNAEVRSQFEALANNCDGLKNLRNWLDQNLSLGHIDVNIMTKLDKPNYREGNPLGVEHNDAHAALRGYAKSELESSVVLSAGMNPRLYSYIENFDDFFPDARGFIKKKIIIKVSDYRSALIQGKFLAKKGIWVSEFRIESGLNCGGHAFATDGSLMGPILEEFGRNRKELAETLEALLIPALKNKSRVVPDQGLALRITAQGGVGTHQEHRFLIEQYQLDSVGWGSPFLLVPEATTVDEDTIQKLISADEKDLYLSNVSPLGIPFNNLRGNSKDVEKMEKVEAGRPGSPCPKEFLALRGEPGSRNLCTASRQYQRNQIKLLDEAGLSKDKYRMTFKDIVDKACLCMGLGEASMQVYNLDPSAPKKGVSICPGPNMAYFNKIMSLKDIADHIYGRIDILAKKNRPQMFVKELGLYLSYLSKKIEEIEGIPSRQQQKYLDTFSKNLEQGIDYYLRFSEQVKESYKESFEHLANELSRQNDTLNQLRTRLALL